MDEALVKRMTSVNRDRGESLGQGARMTPTEIV